MVDQKSDRFTIELQVRDYECDMERIVNNATYLNYLEYARHEFLKTAGIDFAELTRRGINPVVIRAEVDYKSSLRSGDHFRVGVSLERVSRLRVAFVQDIYRLSDSGLETGDTAAASAEAHPRELDRTDLVARARIFAAVISVSGRPVVPEEMGPQFAELLSDPS